MLKPQIPVNESSEQPESSPSSVDVSVVDEDTQTAPHVWWLNDWNPNKGIMCTCGIG